MKIKIPGEMSIADMRQCILEQLFDMSERFNIRYARGINLYFTPTDGEGNEVICRNGRGEEISHIESEGPYASAALRILLGKCRPSDAYWSWLRGANASPRLYELATAMRTSMAGGS